MGRPDCALILPSPARVACGLALALALAVPAGAAEVAGRRGLWVLCEGSQRVLEHPERVPVLLADADALGVTDLFVQIYRGGKAWYPAQLADPAPYARVRAAGGEVDTLQALIAGAHERGMRVHAWVNVLSLSKNPNAPLLAALGKGAVTVDQKGRSVLDYPDYEVPQPDRTWVRMGTPAIWLDPAAPGVSERIVATFAELLENVPGLDGLHLDYIRYADALPFVPGTRFGVGLGFGFGEATRARFRGETGLKAPFGTSLINANRWDAWRRGQLTTLVASIAAQARQLRPGLEMSAAVIADRERAYQVDMQDWLTWVDAGHLDFAVPMLYTRDDRLLRYGVEVLNGLAARRGLMVGLGSWLFAKEPERAVGQMRDAYRAPRVGEALFSWDAIRETPALLNALATEAAGERARAAR